MRRLLLLSGLVLVVAAAVLWLVGRPPSAYVLSQECERYQDERRDRAGGLRVALMEAEGIDPKSDDTKGARGQYEEFLRSTKRFRLRGWEILIVPTGATAPAPEDFVVAGEFDPSAPRDRPELKGRMQVWIAPRSGLARLFAR